MILWKFQDQGLLVNFTSSNLLLKILQINVANNCKDQRWLSIRFATAMFRGTPCILQMLPKLTRTI